MLLSTNFLKDYIDLDDDLTVNKLADDMTSMGNEYDSAGKFINASKLIIGEVIECEAHPDSDHLHICMVNVGNETLHIVCGAPNVRKGLKVIVALNGAKLPGGEIKKGVIRGQESNGMICSIAELGLDKKFLKEEDIAGICELPSDAPIGADPIKYLGWDDDVIDFDLTANRGDLLSVLGMAYEVGAIYDKKVKPIDLNFQESNKEFNNFNVKVSTDNCKLYLARKVENVTIKESPREIKEKLMASGIRPINNVVDISNYVMLETGQPLHFFDADKLKEIEVRMAKNGEKITTLDSKERTLSDEDIVITDSGNPIALAGVMGGFDTEITENTKNIIIESAIFDSVKVRKTSNRILRSEASNRFEKGLDPNRTYMAMARACKLLHEIANGDVLKGTKIYDKTNKEEKVINITVSKIDRILGATISKDEIISCFNRLDFKCETNNNDDIITVHVPTRRIDISIEEDLIEEVGRVYGVDNIEGKNMIMPLKKGSFNRQIREIRNKMVDLGLNETLTYSLVNEKESSMFTNNKNESIKILSPLTEERSALRQTLTTSLYKVYEYNKAHSNEDISIFEISKAFYKNGEEYIERNRIAALMEGEYFTGLNSQNVDFYVIKGVTEELLDFLGYNGRYSFVTDKEIPNDLHPGKSAMISVNNDVVGFIGRINPIVSKDEVYVMEIDLDKLLDKKVSGMKFKEISKFPTVQKDFAIIVDKNVTCQELQKVIKSNGGRLLLNSKVFDLYEGKGIPDGKKSLAFTITLGANDHTLTDEEIMQELTKITEALNKKFKASLRGNL